MENTSIIFTGDIGFDKYMEGKWEDESLISSSLLSFFKSAKNVCINVEGALFDAENSTNTSQFFHCINPKAINVFSSLGANIWSIGNNHTSDAGEIGVKSTLEYAKGNSVLTIGAGITLEQASKPIYLDQAGGIGMFGVSYMAECIPATQNSAGIFRWDDMALIQKRIDEIKAKCRWCVIIAHGGEEFSSLPNPYTRERYIKYLEMGADVVVGHHPHVVENYERFEDGKMIFYSLGNFIFDTNYQRVHKYTDVGVILRLNFSKDKVTFDAVGSKIDRSCQRITLCELPDIFTDVCESEYNLLAPLSANEFLKAEKKKMCYLEPNRFNNASEKVWNDYFYSDEPDGYFKGAHMDLSLIVPLAKKCQDNQWQKSKLEKVKQYILNQNID